MTNEMLFRRKKVVECYFLEDKDTDYIYYVDANVELFSLSGKTGWPKYAYHEEEDRETYICLFDEHGIARTHETGLFRESVAAYHETPYGEEVDVAWYLKWAMAKVLAKPKPWNRMVTFYSGLALAMFTYEDDGSIGFDCLPFIFPCPELRPNQAFLRRAKIYE